MKRYDVQLGLATDPDADRVGVVFKGQRLTGNQVGVLLSDMLIDEYIGAYGKKGNAHQDDRLYEYGRTHV